MRVGRSKLCLNGDVRARAAVYDFDNAGDAGRRKNGYEVTPSRGDDAVREDTCASQSGVSHRATHTGGAGYLGQRLEPLKLFKSDMHDRWRVLTYT